MVRSNNKGKKLLIHSEVDFDIKQKAFIFVGTQTIGNIPTKTVQGPLNLGPVYMTLLSRDEMRGGIILMY